MPENVYTTARMGMCVIRFYAEGIGTIYGK